MIRSPIVSVLGHVDHGKTTLLDAIRRSKVAEKEAGRITQMIGTSYVPKGVIEGLSKGLADRLGVSLRIPGLLFIDTPGHEAFTSLRERGGSISDIAILAIDINQGVQRQTIESIDILRTYKTPFVVAATKIDLIRGWKSQNTYSFLESWPKQTLQTQNFFEEKFYNLVSQLAEYGFNSERFDRIKDFTKEVAIVPVSAYTHEGLAELLLLVAGLSQKYLGDRLIINEGEKALGAVIEVRRERGLGPTVDVIVYDGILKKGDVCLFLTKEGEVIERKVRALLMPKISTNNPSDKYEYVDKVVAAAGVRILASDLGDVLPGSPFGVKGRITEEELKKDFSAVVWESEEEGVVVKADSLGSAEAMLKLLREKGISVKKVGIGEVTKEDILIASSVGERKPLLGVVLAFSVPISQEIVEFAKSQGVGLIHSRVIYSILDQYEDWRKAKEEELKRLAYESLGNPGKFKVLKGFFFRVSKPAIFGVEVLAGRIKPGNKVLAPSGRIVGEIKSIQENKVSLKEASKGQKVAISLDGAVLGKDIHEEEILYVYIPEENISQLLPLPILTEEEKEVLRELRKILLRARFEEK